MSNTPILTDLEEKKAPWNQEDKKYKEIEVAVSLTVSKTVKVMVNDYISENYIDEDGNHCTNYDFSQCDIRKAVLDQIILPNETKALDGWNVDDLEVILE